MAENGTPTPPTPPTQPPVSPPSSTPPPKRSAALPQALWIAVGLLVAVGLFYLTTDTSKTISFTDFDKLAGEGQLKKLSFQGKQRAEGEVRDASAESVKELKLSTGGKFSINLPATNDQNQLIDRLQKKDKDYRDKLKAANPADATPEIQLVVSDEAPQIFGPLIWTLLPLVIVGAIIFFFLLPRLREGSGGGFLSSYIRSPAKKYEKTRTRTTFEDVAGMETVKRELAEIVDFLRNPDKFTRLGAQVPKGVLLVGPPGTGKTLLARAVAGEAHVPFFSINGSEFIQMFVGVGASRVRDLFKNAKDAAPCVIFIDEIDAVGRMRGAGVGGGSDEREQTLNQILSEMDGFQATETVIVLAATNRPDVLDAALLRPGRFDRHVTVERPTWQGRLAILKVHTRNKPLDDKVDLERIARGMIGMSGADLRNLCNEAALVATREGKNRIEHADFDTASDRVRLGAKREEIFGDDEKRRTAYHEAGHALCAWLEPKADPLDRVSIIPRGRTAGVTMFSPDEDRVDMSFSELMARLVVVMGGRAADKLIFGEALTGEIGDLKQATRIARAMVTQYGMSDKLGPVHYRAGEDHVFLGKEIVEQRDFSEGTARIIDKEVQRILRGAEERALELIGRNREDLDAIANALLASEELDREAFEKLLRKAPRPEVEPKPETTADAPPPRLAFEGV